MKCFIKNKKWMLIALSCLMITFNLMLPGLTDAQEDEFVIHMVTGEFKAKTKDGKEIEAYRWDPGTIFVPKGKEVTLSIYGVNGELHPFYIEGTSIKGNVKKGEETRVKVKFDKEGIYRIVCTAHETIEQNGPMIGYIVVD